MNDRLYLCLHTLPALCVGDSQDLLHASFVQDQVHELAIGSLELIKSHARSEIVFVALPDSNQVTDDEVHESLLRPG
eukprot:4543260-Amphidinium_carterae.2